MNIKFWMTDGSMHVANDITDRQVTALMDLLNSGSKGDKRVEIKGTRLMVRHIVRFKVEK